MTLAIFTLLPWMIKIDLEIQTHKFKRDRRRYLTIADVKRIEEVMEKPWLAGPDKEEKASHLLERTPR